MNLRESYLQRFTENMIDAVELTRRKGQDYAPGNDPFKNFRLIGHVNGTDVPNGILVRLTDKLARFVSLMSRPDNVGAVADEKITDTLADLMVYSNILLVWYQLGQPAANYLEGVVTNTEASPTSDIDDTKTNHPVLTAVGDKLAGLFRWGTAANV